MDFDHIGCHREPESVGGDCGWGWVAGGEHLQANVVTEGRGRHRYEFQVVSAWRVGIANPLEVIVGRDPVE
jgi:hypothetical protein